MRSLRHASVLLATLMAVLTLAPSIAQACGRPPPPPWHILTGESGRDVWVGRVTNVTQNPTPIRGERVLVYEATATIERLEIIHGTPPEVYSYTAVAKYEVIDGSNLLLCVFGMAVKEGEVVLLIDDPHGVYTYDLSNRDYVSRLEFLGSPPDVMSRLDAYQ